jgi:hypothetical protein
MPDVGNGFAGGVLNAMTGSVASEKPMITVLPGGCIAIPVLDSDQNIDAVSAVLSIRLKGHRQLSTGDRS